MQVNTRVCLITFFRMCFLYFGLKKCFDVIKGESNFKCSVNVLCLKLFVTASAFSLESKVLHKKNIIKRDHIFLRMF